jgi:bacillolysin
MFTPRALAPALALTLLAGPASADPRIQARSLATAPAAPIAVSPSEIFAARVGSALQAARSPRGQGIAPAASVLQTAPLASRVGVDVSFKVRPGVGSAMQIRGSRLQNAHGTDLATAQTFLSANRSLLRLQDPERELAPAGRFQDELGLSHLRFEQRYQGLRVWPAEVLVHLDEEGSVYLLNGAYVPTPTVGVRPVFSAGAAVRKARTVVPEGSATEPELFVFAPGDRAPRLAWRVEVEVSEASRWLVVIDAVNGARLLAYDQVMHAHAAGSGRDLSGATRELDLWRSGKTFYMVDTSKAMFDGGSAPPMPATTRGAIFVFDLKNQDDPARALAVSSRNPASWAPAEAVSAAFGLSSAYDYFLEVHGRSSLDAKGGNLYAFVRYGKGVANALWNGEAMLFGDGRPYAGALDVVGHELTHGITQHSAGLMYSDQPGALNEAFSDIFGQAVEARIEGGADWVVGDDLGTPLRDMRNPRSLNVFPGHPYPSRMSEIVGPGDPLLDRMPGRDNGGVHVNSSIVNRAFYLLAEGLPGAIGMEDAARIFYRALTIHLTGNSQFLDARLACIQSAEELFGAGSVQALKTADAFDEVEIFEAGPPAPRVPDSADSALGISFSFSAGGFVLQRRETGDPQPLGTAGVARPSVSGDGKLAFYVDTAKDACFVAIDGNRPPSCLGLPGRIRSASMSRGSSLFGFVLDNVITIVDLDAKTETTYELPLLHAGTLDFAAGGRYVFFDALDAEGWGVYALDRDLRQLLEVVRPVAGLDVVFPSLSRTGDGFLAFEADDPESGGATVYTLDLATGDLKAAAFVEAGPAVASYTANDGALVFSDRSATPTTRSLFWQELAGDWMTAVGDPVLWLENATHGVAWRRLTGQP